MKKFAREHPDKYNYNRAQIPLNALTEEELAEKKRAQRKIKREKEKEKKKENHVKQKEMAEKDRFVNLSDREKVCLFFFYYFIDKIGTFSEGVSCWKKNTERPRESDFQVLFVRPWYGGKSSVWVFGKSVLFYWLFKKSPNEKYYQLVIILES